mmetsp:Transcript_88990/g.256554  ORF Transcript_88990/g.256554 Transcript_88990/m.256554 type:complete len:253 (-) Transcript_88990:26-784(-)
MRLGVPRRKRDLLHGSDRFALDHAGRRLLESGDDEIDDGLPNLLELHIWEGTRERVDANHTRPRRVPLRQPMLQPEEEGAPISSVPGLYPRKDRPYEVGGAQLCRLGDGRAQHDEGNAAHLFLARFGHVKQLRNCVVRALLGDPRQGHAEFDSDGHVEVYSIAVRNDRLQNRIQRRLGNTWLGRPHEGLGEAPQDLSQIAVGSHHVRPIPPRLTQGVDRPQGHGLLGDTRGRGQGDDHSELHRFIFEVQQHA